MKNKEFKYTCAGCKEEKTYLTPKKLPKRLHDQKKCIECAFGGPKGYKKAEETQVAFCTMVRLVFPGADVGMSCSPGELPYLSVVLPANKIAVHKSGRGVGVVTSPFREYPVRFYFTGAPKKYVRAG